MPFHVAIAKAFATAGGAGYSPVAPGTAGTVVAIPLAWAMARWLPEWGYGLVLLGIIAVGIVAADIADRAWNTHDSGRICIDEVAGYLVTVWVVDRSSLVWLLVGFVVFRVLDIVKPPPVRWVDRKVQGGAGVVLDDVMAGIYGALVMWLAYRVATGGELWP